MRILLDENLPGRTVGLLQTSGADGMDRLFLGDKLAEYPFQTISRPMTIGD